MSNNAVAVEVNKADIIERLSVKVPHLAGDVVAKSVNALLDQMVNVLSKGERVEIRGFGSFTLVKREARKGRNPKTGESVIVDDRYVPRFKAGQKLRFGVNS